MEYKQQIKSKSRVANHGEVFTSKKIVNDMLDLVKQETERIESRFLEPACGNGNFLAEILERKLAVVKAKYGKSESEYKKYAFIAVTSIYGVELLQDNVEECRQRLFDIFCREILKNSKIISNYEKESYLEAILYVLTKNILCGNALTLHKVDAEALDTEEPIIFSEWNFTFGDLVKRRDYRLDVLLKENADANSLDATMSLFDDEDSYQNWDIDPITGKFIPKPLQEFKPVEYWRVQENG